MPWVLRCTPRRPSVRATPHAFSGGSTANSIVNDDAGSEDYFESDFDADVKTALSAVVSARLATMLGQPSAAAGPKNARQDRVAYAGLCGERLVNVLCEFPQQHVGRSFDCACGAVRARRGLLGGRGRAYRCGRHVRPRRHKAVIVGGIGLPRRAVSGAHGDPLRQRWISLRWSWSKSQGKICARYACAARSTRFYKARDRPGKFVQLGTVLQGRDEFYTSRLMRKTRCIKY
jgi:hypothetical protein